MSFHPSIQPVIDVTDENLVISVPLSQIAALADSDKYFPVEITDRVVFARFVANYLKKPKYSEHNIKEALTNSIHYAFDDAIYVGAGIRSRLEDIPYLIDRMWRDHDKILTIWEGFPPSITPHMCLIEAIRAAGNGDLESAARWLEVGQDLKEDIAKSLQENIEEAMQYAIATYGSESSGSD